MTTQQNATQTQPMPRLLRSLVKGLAVVAVNLVIISVLCFGFEIYLRLTDPFTRLPFDTSYYKNHKKYYPELIVPETILEDDISWGHHISTNAFNFREREFDRPKPRDVCRIVVLGDSFTWGAGLDMDERYTTLVEEQLRERFPGQQIEVITLAQRGWPTVLQRDALRNFKDWLSPDFIVETFVINDPQPKTQDFTEEKVLFYEKYGGIIESAQDSLVQIGLPRTAQLMSTALDSFLVKSGVLPPWEVGMQRTYELDSAEWKNFAGALKDIKQMSDEMQLPQPLFIVLNHKVFWDQPTEAADMDPELPIYLRWYHQAEQTAAQLGFRTYNHERELIEQISRENIPLNVLDDHPSAQVNEIYAQKLLASLIPEIEQGALCSLPQGVAPATEAPLEAKRLLSVKMGNKIRFLGYVADTSTQESSIRLNFGWQSLAKIEENYVIVLEVVGAEGKVWARQEELPCQGKCLTSFWPAGMIAPPGASVIYWPEDSRLIPTPLEELPYEGVFQDLHEIRLDNQLPAGDYLLRMGLYDRASGQFLPAYDETGEGCLCEQQVPLGTISISGN